jgi:hypothetical protein
MSGPARMPARRPEQAAHAAAPAAIRSRPFAAEPPIQASSPAHHLERPATQQGSRSHGHALDRFSILPVGTRNLPGPLLQRPSNATRSWVHNAAKLGTSGTGTAFPHREAIGASFGKHDISRVEAHTDQKAEIGTWRMGVSAFTIGNHVAFAGRPSLFTAAHEAAHAIQQRSGACPPGGVGRPGDRYERHADAVASRVIRGQSSEDVLDDMAGGQRSTSAVQMINIGWVPRNPQQFRRVTDITGVSTSMRAYGSFTRVDTDLVYDNNNERGGEVGGRTRPPFNRWKS